MKRISEGPYIPHFFDDEVTEMYSAHLGWLTVAVHHSIPWPEKDVVVRYDGEDYYLHGIGQREGEQSCACILVRTSEDEDLYFKLNKIYRFASILGWYKCGYVAVVSHINGSHPVPYSAGKQPFGSVIVSGPYGFDCNYMPVVSDDNTRKALAFWRDGVRLQHIHDGYSFLSFYKVIESQFRKGEERKAWIADNLSYLTDRAANRVLEIREMGSDVGEHIYLSGRCAVAHATLDRTDTINPDNAEDLDRISKDLVVIRALADRFIRKELGVPDENQVLKHRDALSPGYRYLKQAHIEEIRNKGTVNSEELGLNQLEVSVNNWPHKASQAFQQLVLSVVSVHDGIVELRASNKSRTFYLGFLWDFINRKALTNLDASGVFSPNISDYPEHEIAYLEYMKAVIGNGKIEIQFPNSEKVVCEIVIPVNIDLVQTFSDLDDKIHELKKRLL